MLDHLSQALARIDQVLARIEEIQTRFTGPKAPAAGQGAAHPVQEAVQLENFEKVLTQEIQKIPTIKPAAGQNTFFPIIEKTAAKYGLDGALLKAIVRQESDFNPNSVSSRGAMGLMQLMPETARGLGVTNPFDAVQNVDGGARYFRDLLLRFNGDVVSALAGYNAGPNAVKKYGGIPPYTETQNFVRKVMDYWKEYQGQAIGDGR